MNWKLAAQELDTISVDQLSRHIFKFLKWMQGDKSYPSVFGSIVVGAPSPLGKKRFDDAWFRLVDRGLIRWEEGPNARHHYMLTERGESSRYGEGTVEDPEPSIAAVEGAIGKALDPVIKQYLQEAIATFHDGRLLASQFCIGAVAERVTFLVRDWITDKIQDGAKLAKKTKVGEIIDGLTAGLTELKKARPDIAELADLLDCVEHFAHAYRRSRNDVGHPTEVRDVNEDELAVLLTAMQRRYLPCAYKVLDVTL